MPYGVPFGYDYTSFSTTTGTGTDADVPGWIQTLEQGIDVAGDIVNILGDLGIVDADKINTQVQNATNKAGSDTADFFANIFGSSLSNALKQNLPLILVGTAVIIGIVVLMKKRG